ncbi:MAG TPA: di-heme oxidoredictase family protein [Bryobacteraceae bacterium]|nr:di-heme oxidoredictase family protein [Bryobacteraceae bacterium]
MARLRNRLGTLLPIVLLAMLNGLLLRAQSDSDGQPDSHAPIGVEVAILDHLQDGQELKMPIRKLIRFGEKLFSAAWTIQEGAGRPNTKGTGNPLSDPSSPLVFPRNFNRISAPDTNSCSGCHNKPRVGGGGDIVGNVFVLGQRFDYATFNELDTIPTRGGVDEKGNAVNLQTISNSRKTVGMFGSGFIEMLARQVTADLQAIRDRTPAGGSSALVSKGISFGAIARHPDGTWDTSGVVGISAPSLVSIGAGSPPSLIIRPLHQAANVISLRQFTNNAFNHHHGMQAEERFGLGVDADGDGFVNELTRADITAASVFQATLPAPGRVISSDSTIRAAVINGEAKFAQIGCTNCHIPSLPLNNQGWIYTEPNPYNPSGNLRPSDGVSALAVDLTSDALPGPRLKVANGAVNVPAYTDLKLHDITSGLGDPNREPLDMNQPAGSPGFFAGNGKFITRKLWGIANQHPFGHHGQYTTMRESVLAHAGEAQATTTAFLALSKYDQDSVIEFLKSLQILPPNANSLCVDEAGEDTSCPKGILP